MKIYCKILVLFLGVLSTACTSASEKQGIVLPTSNIQRMPIDNLDLSAKEFWRSYMSKDVQERRLAEMYLSGAVDSTEGSIWCDYSLALPGSILEQIYIGFKKASEPELKMRASTLIALILSKKLPCKGENK